MDVVRAAKLYNKGWTLRQIGAELGVMRLRSAKTPGTPNPVMNKPRGYRAA
jgi:hypothetical protein